MTDGSARAWRSRGLERRTRAEAGSATRASAPCQTDPLLSRYLAGLDADPQPGAQMRVPSLSPWGDLRLLLAQNHEVRQTECPSGGLFRPVEQGSQSSARRCVASR